MLIRRILLIAVGLVLLWAGPAQADHVYGHILGVGDETGVTSTVVTVRVNPGTVAGTGGAVDDDDRASTGGGRASNSGIARTGAVVVPTALLGVGLILTGAALKRSSRRAKAIEAV